MPPFSKLLLLSFTVLSFAASHGVSAHAIIVSSQPAAGAAISQDATAIQLRFNSRIDHARSRLQLFAPDGSEQALTLTVSAPADELDAEARTLAPGAWRVHWQVLSVDGHITRGDIPFTVH